MSIPARKKHKPTTAGLVQHIGDTLGENKSGPLTLIRRIIKTLGPEISLAYLERTLEIEKQGGLLSNEGKRRTPGGIFFHLIKSERPKEETFPIFWLKPYVPREPMTRPISTPRPQSLIWEGRRQVLAKSQERSNVSATIQLRGQPEAGSIIDTGSCVILTVQNTKHPNIPKGIPVPPEGPVKYDVYISYKLWKKVKETVNDEEDTLIIDGYPRIDQESNSIAVIATGTSSRKLKTTEKTKRPEEETRGGRAR